jgi:RNA recognition motif-containing protein
MNSKGFVLGALPKVQKSKNEKEKESNIKVKAMENSKTKNEMKRVEFDADDYRIFVGNLDKKVNETMLQDAFSQYKSLLKVMVVTDKRSGQSKGFGFLSLKDPFDYQKAMRDMQGKYIGAKPVKLVKSKSLDTK